MPINTLPAAQVPNPTAPTGFNKNSGASLNAKQFMVGETATQVGKMNSNAVMLDNAYRYGSGICGIGYGLGLTISSNSTVIVGAGHGVAGTLVELPTDTTVVVAPNVSRAWIWLLQSGQPVVVTNGSTSPPEANAILLGSCVTNSTTVTSLDYSGVIYLINGIALRYTADTGTPGDSPNSTLCFFTRTSGGLYFWQGTAYYPVIPQSVINSRSSNQLGFFNATPAVKQTTANPAALTAPSTMSGSYTQSEVQKLRDDIAALRTTVLALTTALQTYGLG